MAVPSSVIEDAKVRVRMLHNQGRIDDDDWISLSPDWDLNVWIDMDGCTRATIYPVVDGKTDSTRPYPLEL